MFIDILGTLSDVGPVFYSSHEQTRRLQNPPPTTFSAAVEATKVLKAMGLEEPDKSEQALQELQDKGMI